MRCGAMGCRKCRAKSLWGAVEINLNCSAMRCKTPSAHVTKIVDAVQCGAMQCGAMRCSAQNAGQNLSVEVWKSTRTAVQCNAKHPVRMSQKLSMQCSAMRCNAVRCDAVHKMQGKISLWRSGNQPELQCNAMQNTQCACHKNCRCSAVRCDAMRCDAMQCIKCRAKSLCGGQEIE